ncbi:MAG: methylenetetrahydrofolate--tRNA-(uracil(54)-C(5))-methyltransferase (FADH(2)-oxidizing) TrmFO [Alphaproteobacteria bacterium]|nr:MAG: methylenetetrahydrofolate--tRNA-(uracil(54)-C(5))-methyltransferase (FADH(2)-oxidizing) TrmFO [Alphaproteobacteria bacterium]
MKPVHIIGGGLAGSEAAWQVASAGHPVVIHEMRPVETTDAHETSTLAELVCSNSFRSDDYENNAVGLLHEEMRRCNSLIMQCASDHRVPAGGALAVDRLAFSTAVEETLLSHKLVSLERGAVNELPPEDWGQVIIATGPLTHGPLAEAIRVETGYDSLAFYDAIAPIVYQDSIDFSTAWMQSRWDRGAEGIGDGADYVNCPLSETQYNAFIDGLIAADKTAFKEWEKDTPYFEACLPIEVMAERGPMTLAFGPMKPVGLKNPHQEEQPYAVVQLRQDNKLGTLYNMVGFQTKMTYGAQTDLLRTIPGLENARFARLGGIHRNTFMNSPHLLDDELRLKSKPHLRFAGQMTGVEGYVESSAMGLLAGRFAAANMAGSSMPPPPTNTALGGLLAHITTGHIEGREIESGKKAKADSFQPMNINFGLLPPLNQRMKKRDRKPAMSKRALVDLDAWLAV